jgi:creatinine amidohydrolase
MVKYLAEMSWPEFKGIIKRNVVIIWPMGPIEEHGPHLPFGVDYFCAEEVAKRTAEILGKKSFEVIIIPTLPYTVSVDGMAFPGNITLKCETLVSIIRDVCESLASHGVRNIVILCHHLEPENTQCINKAIQDIKRIRDIKIISIFPIIWERILPQMQKIVETDLEYDLHAGEWETSQILFLRPELIKRKEWLKTKPVAIKLMEEKAKGKLFKDIAGATQGYFGNPLKASREKGERIFQLMAKVAADVIIEFVSSI